MRSFPSILVVPSAPAHPIPLTNAENKIGAITVDSCIWLLALALGSVASGCSTGFSGMRLWLGSFYFVKLVPFSLAPAFWISPFRFTLSIFKKHFFRRKPVNVILPFSVFFRENTFGSFGDGI